MLSRFQRALTIKDGTGEVGQELRLLNFDLRLLLLEVSRAYLEEHVLFLGSLSKVSQYRSRH